MNIELPRMASADDKMEGDTTVDDAGEGPALDSCDKNHDPLDATITISLTSKQAEKTVAPFLAKHIPEQYAPMGSRPAPEARKDPNTRYCYRHRPDAKCRRTADEPTMEILQRVCFLAAAGGNMTHRN
jgi:F-box/WD-40 domain protein MET30